MDEVISGVIWTRAKTCVSLEGRGDSVPPAHAVAVQRRTAPLQHHIFLGETSLHLPTNTTSRQFYLSYQARQGLPGTGGCESWLFYTARHIVLGAVRNTESQASVHRPTPMNQHSEARDARQAPNPRQTGARRTAAII
ncbi:hypothetical protein E2C01_012219 [Portunus trituberculatus]|uniref:Uncharacterized protein n=1 Tax=Portunus trituberculatus TaxID=210409 RepID=A0A5B7DDK7_PORTR|nr:hypothetical protein [Portunus trituberculatus]